MTSSRFLRAVAVGVFTATVVLSSPAASARQNGDDPRDPVARFVKYIKKIFTVITHDDQPIPPKP